MLLGLQTFVISGRARPSNDNNNNNNNNNLQIEVRPEAKSN